MGHLYKGGMWFKKKAYISGFNTNTAVDGTDWRINPNNQSWSVSYTLPDATDANNYFYLPALGFYNSGQMIGLGSQGYYWSSSAYPWSSSNAYNLFFYSGGIGIYNNFCYNGVRGTAFE